LKYEPQAYKALVSETRYCSALQGRDMYKHHIHDYVFTFAESGTALKYSFSECQTYLTVLTCH